MPNTESELLGSSVPATLSKRTPENDRAFESSRSELESLVEARRSRAGYLVRNDATVYALAVGTTIRAMSK